MKKSILTNLDIFLSKKYMQLSKHGGEIRRVFMEGQKLKSLHPNIDLIDLSLGNPDVEAQEKIDNYLIEILSRKEKSSHRYMDASGLPEIREYVAEQLSLSEKMDIHKDTVYFTVGAAGGIQILLRSFLDEQDEVIIFSPYFPEYIPYILSYNSVPVICPSDANHKPNFDYLSECITEKTKCIIINSPNNPTGIIYNKDDLKKIFSLLIKRYESNGQIIHVISDEPYRRIAYNEQDLSSVLSMYPFTWVVRSFSKDVCLAGERIGYIFWSKILDNQFPGLIDVFRNASRMLGFVSAPRLMQRLIPYIFNLKVDVSIYEQRVRNFVNYLMNNGFKVIMPQAGFFVFPQSPILDDREFCNRLLNYNVLCVPGAGFGLPGYFRASLTQELSTVEEGAKRIVDCAHYLSKNP